MYVSVLKKYAVFKGRAPRKEYWLFLLWNFIIGLVLTVVDENLGLRTANRILTAVDVTLGLRTANGIGILTGLYSVFVFVPGLALSVRRLHDTGHSGWWMLILFVPLVGPIIYLIFVLQASQQTVNNYGPPIKNS